MNTSVERGDGVPFVSVTAAVRSLVSYSTKHHKMIARDECRAAAISGTEDGLGDEQCMWGGTSGVWT